MPREVTLTRLRSFWPMYAFAVPSAVLIALFAYYPAANAMYHAFFRWNCSTVEEFNGLQNFRDLLGFAPGLWFVTTAWVVSLLMTLTGRPARVRKWAPWVLGGVVLLTGLALGAGALLQKTGAEELRVLHLPARSAAGWFLRSLLFTVGGLLLHGWVRQRWSAILRFFLLLYAFLWFFYNAMLATGDRILWAGFAVTFIFVVSNLFKMVPSITTAVVIHRLKSERWQYIYRVLFVIPMIIPGMVYLLLWKFFYDPTQGILNRLLNGSGLMNVLVWLDNLCHWGVFRAGTPPSWLGDASLVIPALIFWGFPWIGVVGVLIYLAGLQSISPDVYEAADIDGVNWFQKFTHIELPLITTQVRINLILMIIGTLQDYGLILVILGDAGGPQGVALVPGLYMFRSAFVEGAAGKGCAIGLILFFFILLLTEINNRYVRVEK
jgi:raffinose/stachyose/melibiose transport system permease protein